MNPQAEGVRGCQRLQGRERAGDRRLGRAASPGLWHKILLRHPAAALLGAPDSVSLPRVQDRAPTSTPEDAPSGGWT